MERINGKISSVVCWTVCHATESGDKIREAVEFLTGKDAEFEWRKTETHFHQPMELLYARLKGRDGLERVLSEISDEGLKEIIETVEDRMDDDNVLHFRLDKQACFLHSPILSSRVVPRDRKEHDSIDVEVRAITYPGSRSNAVKFISDILHEIMLHRQG